MATTVHRSPKVALQFRLAYCLGAMLVFLIAYLVPLRTVSLGRLCDDEPVNYPRDVGKNQVSQALKSLREMPVEPEMLEAMVASRCRQYEEGDTILRAGLLLQSAQLFLLREGFEEQSPEYIVGQLEARRRLREAWAVGMALLLGYGFLFGIGRRRRHPENVAARLFELDLGVLVVFAVLLAPVIVGRFMPEAGNLLTAWGSLPLLIVEIMLVYVCLKRVDTLLRPPADDAARPIDPPPTIPPPGATGVPLNPGDSRALEHIEKLIRLGSLDEAAETGTEFLSQRARYKYERDDWSQIVARYNGAKKDFRRGLMTDAELRAQKDRTSLAMIDLIRLIRMK